jgi:methyl-accepting chemotaxis protein
MNLSISKKLYLLILPTLAMSLIVAFTTWSSLKNGTGQLKKANELSQQALLSRFYVSEMSDALKGYILDPANVAEAERKKSADDHNGQTIDKMKTLTTDADFLNAIQALGDFDDKHLNPAEDKVLELVKSQKVQEAQDAFVKEYLPLRQQYNKMSEELAERAHKLSENGVVETEEEMTSALHFIFLALGLGTTLLIGWIVAVSRQISTKLRSIANHLSESEVHLNHSSHSLASAGQQVSAGTTETAASLEESVASIEELSSMVKVNSHSAQSAAELSKQSSMAASKGQIEIRSLEHAMGELSEASKKIEEITGVIDDIAFQTNLLALNAAVEAARAGEQGKGFAVVAEAVRQLAQKSAVAARDISTLIHDSTAKTAQGVAIATKSGEVFEQIVGDIKKISDLNFEISTASTEQSNGISQISQSLQELDRATQGNARAADQVSDAAQGMAQQGVILKDLVDSLRVLVEGGHIEMEVPEDRPSTVSKIHSQKAA